MGRSKKAAAPARSNTELRRLVLEYFYERSQNATSARGKQGLAIKISDVKRELRLSEQLSQKEVMANLLYLLSEGWVEEEKVEKQVPTKSGTVVPSTTSYYKITARGIDKIEGEGEFTMDKFKGIKIEATGQNIITVGDGNQVNALHKEQADALLLLRSSVLTAPELSEPGKLDIVSDIDTIQTQLAKATPSRTIVSAAWDSIKNLATGASLAVNLAKVGELLAPLC